MSVKANRVINILTLISASFAFICYIFYILGGTILADSGGIFVTIFILTSSTLPIIFAKYVKRLLGKFYNIMKIIYCCCFCLYMILFLIFSGIIIFHTENEPEIHADNTVVIVCGSRVYGYTPGETLKTRLDRAYEILEENPNALCIVSGGQGDDETISEALCMKTYLVNLGIASTRIYMEDKSRNTEENIEYSMQVMKTENIPLNSNIICVSSDFHTARIALIASDLGLEVQCAAADSPTFIRYFSSLVREFMSYIKYFIFK